MFRSEEEKMKLYRSNLGREAKNQFKQGEALDSYLLYEKGIETQEKGTNKFAEAIGDQIGKNIRILLPKDRIQEWVTTKSKATSDSLDDNIMAKSKNAPKAITQPKSDDIIRPKSKKAPRSLKQPPQPKDLVHNDRERENALMGAEDTNYVLTPIASQSATAADIAAQNEAQANLDLISLFQQDVKEGRKRQALIDLKQLSVDEDRRLRQNFMNALEDMMDEVNNRSANAKAKKQYQEDKRILDKMMNLIENQRMHDSFMEFSKLAMTDSLASKIQRNMKSALNYKKSMNIVNSYLKKERIGVARDNVNKSQVRKTMNDLLDNVDEQVATNMGRDKAANTIKQRMAELRARKAAKHGKRDRFNTDLSAVSTELGSVAPMTFDARAFNPGRPARSITDKYKEMTEIMNTPVHQRSKAGKKKLRNLKGKNNKDAPVIGAMMDILHQIN